MRRCEVHILQAGHCRHPEAATLIRGGLGPVTFPNLTGLILHPSEGAVLFDTGYDPAFLTATEPFPERLYRWLTPPRFGPEEPVRQQLSRYGLSPKDVRWVILSHFHGDHIAGLGGFPDARIVCARAGLRAATAGGPWRALRGGVLQSLIPADLDSRVTFFEDLPPVPLPTACRPFAEGADLFGDGALLAVPLPGHCPGHWGLVARAETDALHFLVADAAWSSRAIRENRPPPALTTTLLGATQPYRETLQRLHEMTRGASELIVTPAHCAERAADLAQGQATE
ncbi:MAG: MBL fold metallo-hydrolase [Caulobacter sp.]|nr:MBL fold metallo-hydrolase [Caulobacter sp.]